MRKDDPRFEEEDEALMAGRNPRYVHRKPSAATKRAFLVGETVLSNPVARSLLDSPTARTVAGTAVAASAPKLVPAVARAIKAASGAARVAGAAALGDVALVLSAGIASYFGTRYLIDHFPTKQRRLAAAADAYKRAKQDAAIAAGLGRDGAYALPKPILKALSDHFKQVQSEINAYPF